VAKKEEKKKATTPQPHPVPQLRTVEDWDAEIEASQPKEDWNAEIAVSQ
jgi:hypothetical protein